jgi:DNA-binding SARP family transcriptional activator
VALWGEEAPEGAVKTVQVHVSRLRKALGSGGRVSRTAAGYRLRVEPGELDSERFEQLTAAGRRALAGGDSQHAGALLREALELWRGPPLDDLGYEPFAQGAIARLEEQRWEALEARAEADLESGRHYELVGELQSLIKRAPLRERLRAQLMLALYRSGRQADALATFHDAREALPDEFGVEPGPELRDVYDRILRHDESLRLQLAPATLPPALAAARPSGSLLVGRAEEMALLRGLWDGVKRTRAGARVALVGPEGIGKTRLAAELAGEVGAGARAGPLPQRR